MPPAASPAASIDAVASLPAASIGVVAASASAAGTAGAVLAGAVLNTAGYAAGYVGFIDSGPPLQTALRAINPRAALVTVPLLWAAAHSVHEDFTRRRADLLTVSGEQHGWEKGDCDGDGGSPSAGAALWALIAGKVRRASTDLSLSDPLLPPSRSLTDRACASLCVGSLLRRRLLPRPCRRPSVSSSTLIPAPDLCGVGSRIARGPGLASTDLARVLNDGGRG